MGAVCTGQSLPRKVLIIGPKGAGGRKTTLLYAWCTHKTDTETVPTESFNIETVRSVKTGHHMIVWDVTDPQRRRQFYHGTDAVVYVIDGSSSECIAQASTDINIVLKDRDLANLPVLMVLSKGEKSGMSLSEIEKELQIAKLVREKYASISVSRTHSESYSEAFEMLCDLMFS